MNLQVIVCFFVFDKNSNLLERKYALISKHEYQKVEKRAWDKNEVVKFNNNLPRLTKLNLIKDLNSSSQ